MYEQNPNHGVNQGYDHYAAYEKWKEEVENGKPPDNNKYDGHTKNENQKHAEEKDNKPQFAPGSLTCSLITSAIVMLSSCTVLWLLPIGFMLASYNFECMMEEGNMVVAFKGDKSKMMKRALNRQFSLVKTGSSYTLHGLQLGSGLIAEYANHYTPSREKAYDLLLNLASGSGLSYQIEGCVTMIGEWKDGQIEWIKKIYEETPFEHSAIMDPKRFGYLLFRLDTTEKVTEFKIDVKRLIKSLKGLTKAQRALCTVLRDGNKVVVESHEGTIRIGVMTQDWLRWCSSMTEMEYEQITANEGRPEDALFAYLMEKWGELSPPPRKKTKLDGN